ncbi:hypothetical protein PVAP13_1NG375900 [Panicum virgatum]|uniref:Uncharacterized protein n=1 Tax=Panicum virgatum TaxID=38727 RepID=A0A8T0X214_PANVG|nr:hypothetical protein PVAP13_1NG375900 [Panicum virgatum]
MLIGTWGLHFYLSTEPVKSYMCLLASFSLLMCIAYDDNIKACFSTFAVAA